MSRDAAGNGLDHVDDLHACDDRWFAAALHRSVDRVEILAEGRTSGSRYGFFRVDDEPVFVKTSGGRPADALRPFIENEFFFYRSIRASVATVPTARFLAGRCDADGRYVLVLEDLTPRLVAVPPDQDERIVRCLAALHRTTWDHPALERFKPPESWRDRVRKRTRNMSADLALPAGEAERLERLIDHPCWDDVQERLRRRHNVSLQHADAHPGNFCFLDDGGACLIDWQRVEMGLPTDDVAHWAVFHGPDDVSELLRLYRGLIPVDDWSFEADFRASVVRSGLVLGAFWVGGRHRDKLVAAKNRVFHALDSMDAWLA